MIFVRNGDKFEWLFVSTKHARSGTKPVVNWRIHDHFETLLTSTDATNLSFY